MALTHHDDIELMPGDDWLIVGNVNDASGSPLDLTNAELMWMLLDPDGVPCSAVAASSLSRVAPFSSGVVNIAVPRNVNAGLDPGRYHDALRVIITNVSDSTQKVEAVWFGPVLIDADPFTMSDPFYLVMLGTGAFAPAGPAFGAPLFTSP